MSEVEVTIEFSDEGVTTSANVIPLGDGLFRLVSVPIAVEGASYGDVIEAETVGEDELRFVKVQAVGGWRVFDFIVAKDWAETDIKEVADEALRRGGHWECVFGGLLFICLPPSCTDWEPKLAGGDRAP